MFFLGCPRVYVAIIHVFLFALHVCQNFEDYLERMSVDGTWGDNLTLQVHLLPCPPPMTLPFPFLRGVLMRGNGDDLRNRFGENSSVPSLTAYPFFLPMAMGCGRLRSKGLKGETL